MESLRDESLQAESQFGIRLSERINYLRKVRLADQGTDIKSVKQRKIKVQSFKCHKHDLPFRLTFKVEGPEHISEVFCRGHSRKLVKTVGRLFSDFKLEL